jgi:hypothetical protein
MEMAEATAALTANLSCDERLNNLIVKAMRVCHKMEVKDVSATGGNEQPLIYVPGK